MYFSSTTEYRFFSFTARSVDVEKDRLKKRERKGKRLRMRKKVGEMEECKRVKGRERRIVRDEIENSKG